MAEFALGQATRIPLLHSLRRTLLNKNQHAHLRLFFFLFSSSFFPASNLSSSCIAIPRSLLLTYHHSLLFHCTPLREASPPTITFLHSTPQPPPSANPTQSPIPSYKPTRQHAIRILGSLLPRGREPSLRRRTIRLLG